jgi:hypothetical protein
MLLVVSVMAGQAHDSSSRVPSKLQPVDESLKDPALRQLRMLLLSAARTGDVNLLGEAMAERVHVDFREVTRQQFIQAFPRTSSEEQRAFWRDLRDAVTLGMARRPSDGLLCAPYVFALLDDDAEEPLYVITGHDVRMRKEPSSASAVIQTLDYDVVRLGPESDKASRDDMSYEWYQIRTSNGQYGWVLSKYVRSKAAPRFCFDKIGSNWRLTTIVRIGD